MAFFTNCRNPKRTALLICGKSLKTVSYINVQLLPSVPKCMANQVYDIFQCLSRNRNYCKYHQSSSHWRKMGLLSKDSCWIPISTDLCKFRQNMWLCSKQQCSPEFIPSWPITAGLCKLTYGICEKILWNVYKTPL